MNGGSLRLDDLPKGAVTRAELVSLLPFLSEVIVVDMPGSLLRSALQHGISALSKSDAATSPSGKFLQVSSTLRFEWYFDSGVPTLGSVTVATPSWSALDDEASYTVAVSEYIANGGDGFDQFAGLDRMSRGLTQADTVALYLAQFTAASPLPAPSDGRIMQTPAVMHLPLGLFCKVPSKAVDMGKPSQREECDHALHMVEVINDKTDGLYDNLLPSALLIVNESYQGCVQGLAERALAELRGDPNLQSLGGDLPATIGPSCSNDVASVTSAQARTSSGWNGVVVSPSSTAPVLTDGEEYPNVVRMSTNEIMIGAGLANLVEHYQWRRVAVLHDDSLWGRGSAGAFMSSFLAGSESAEVINCPNGGQSGSRQLAEADQICAVPEGETRGTQFSLDEMEARDNDDKGALRVTYCRECIVSLLQGLHDKGARIIVLATQPRIAGQIFHLVHETGLLYGKGCVPAPKDPRLLDLSTSPDSKPLPPPATQVRVDPDVVERGYAAQPRCFTEHDDHLRRRGHTLHHRDRRHGEPRVSRLRRPLGDALEPRGLPRSGRPQVLRRGRRSEHAARLLRHACGLGTGVRHRHAFHLPCVALRPHRPP